MAAVALALSSGIACIGATFLAYHEKDGWGWLVFTAVCLAIASTSFSDSTR